MSRPPTSVRDSLDALFSIVFSIDEDLRIGEVSPRALEHMPWLAENPVLTEVFNVERPRQVVNWDQLRQRSDQLLLMTAADGSFAVRGQVVPDDSGSEPRLLFCGAPWLFWLNTERPDLTLGIRDFTPQDAQLDQLFFMTTEKTMVEDLELMNEQLKGAKADLEAAQRGRDAFFAQMSHEMRTPLNGVVSALALLDHHDLSEEAQELLSLVRSSSRNLMHVINYVLDVSKIEAADGVTEQAPLALDDLVESVIEIIGARAREKGLGLHTRIAPGLPRAFLGDAARLRQSLLNLVTNAIKFTDEGEVTVRVTGDDERAGWVRIDVTDTGIGVPGEFRERIFEPFFSVPREGTADQEPGTGLGLDIVRRNVELMGGELSLADGPRSGSTFTLRLPLEPVPEAPVGVNGEREDDETPRTLEGEVLLVDDNQTNLMLGAMLLEKLGVRVRSVSSGEAAVEAVMAARPDLVLMDISMPGIDGFEATRRIRALPGGESLPVLALTAYASSRERGLAEEAGMNGYLTKPVKRSRLASTLAEWLPSGSPAPAPVDGAALVDDGVLRDLGREIGPENLLIVIETFGSEARERWFALSATETPEALAREAHSLISTCRSFGLRAVADGLVAVEREAREGRYPSKDALESLGTQLEAALVALGDWTRRQQENVGA